MIVNKSETCALLRACAASLVALTLTMPDAGLAEAAELVIAHVGPYSGSAAAAGAEYASGAKLYFEHVNDQGGVNGARIALVARDDAGDPELTRSQAADLLPLKPIAFIGAAGTDSVNSLMRVLEKLEMPLLGPIVDLAGVDATSGRGVFHIRPNARQEVEGLVGHLSALGFKNIALCDQRDRSGVRAEVEEDPRQAAKLAVIPRCGGESTDIHAAASAVMNARSQAVVLIGQTGRAAEFIKALRAQRSYAMIFTASSVDPEALAAMLPPATKVWLAVAENMPNPAARGRFPGDPVVQEFLEIRSRSSSPVPLSRTSLAGFVTAKILVEAVRRAGISPTSADVLKALSGPNEFAIGGMTFNFSRTESAAITHMRVGIIGSHGAVLN
jgi:branched-chain amino acid transport system substrate-binding protein